MTYIYSTKITRSKWIYHTISQDQKSLEWGIVADFSQKLLAYVIVQNYTPGGVSSNFNDFGNSGNFEFSLELYGNSRTACAVDKKQQILMIRTQFIIHMNHIVIGDIIASNLMNIFISILKETISTIILL
jgi:hypothetical protein